MNRSASRLTVAIAASLLALSVAGLHAKDRSKWLSAAVDARGVRHRGGDYGGRPAPWMDDPIAKASPEYPEKEKEQRHAGSGLYRLTVDLATGSVTKVRVIQSTGYSLLDQAAIASFQRWRWKPGEWREVDMPVTFTFARPR